MAARHLLQPRPPVYMDGDYCLRMHLTDDLVHAVHETLDREARERDWPRRAVLLAWTRETLAQWRGGLISAEQAAASLRERGLSLRTATM